MMVKWGAGFVLIMLVIGCVHRSPQQRLADFINDPENKIVQSIQIGDVKVITKWLPFQYRNGQLAMDNKQLTFDEGYCYFNVRFEKTAVEKPANDKLLYLNFDMQNDFTLLCAGDSLSPVICQKIENGITGSYEYIVAFYNGNKYLDNNDFTLYYKDKVFGVGAIQFVYQQKDIRKVPGFLNR